MTTDTIDALWKAVERFPCTFGRMSWLDDLSQREEQHAVLGRLLDAYLDAGLDREAEAIRRIIDAPRSKRPSAGAPFIFVHFWRGDDGLWRLQGAARTLCASPREVFEALVKPRREATS